jgi:hypothetical protein
MYRQLFPARALMAEGADVAIDRTGPVVEWSQNWSRLEQPPASCRIVKVRPYPADVVVMQRPARMHWSEMIPHLQSQGIRVVVDVDDLFDAIPKTNIAAYQGYQRGAVHFDYVDRACKLADVVTATTPALIRRYGYGHGVVLPNLVPESYLSIEAWGKRYRTVGWPGVTETHPGDLEVTAGAIPQALAGTKWGFHCIGTGNGVAKALGLREVTSTGMVDFDQYAMAVAELEIGIVPLQASKFNEAKSALKASEMAALGVPVVMSPTPDNLRLHKLGVGMVAESRSQWQRCVSKLIRDLSFREDLAGRGREVMTTQTFERQSSRWAEAWTEKVSVAA